MKTAIIFTLLLIVSAAVFVLGATNIDKAFTIQGQINTPRLAASTTKDLVVTAIADGVMTIKLISDASQVGQLQVVVERNSQTATISSPFSNDNANIATTFAFVRTGQNTFVIYEGNVPNAAVVVDASSILGGLAFVDSAVTGLQDVTNVQVLNAALNDKDVAVVASNSANKCSWKQDTFGAPKPVIAPGYDAVTKQFTLNVIVPKNPIQTTYHLVDLVKTIPAEDTCQATQPANALFTTDSSSTCLNKLSYTFGSAELHNAQGPFEVTVSDNSQGLIATTNVLSTYSVQGSDNECSVYRYVTKVKFQMDLTAAQTEFVSVDNIARFIVTRLYVNANKKFVLEGVLRSTFDKVTSFQSISLTKQDGQLTLDQTSNTPCDSGVCYKLVFTSQQDATSALDDKYTLAFSMSEKPSDSQTPVENTRSLTIDIDIQYTVPVDPTVVSGADITSTVTLYKSTDGSSRPLISYATADDILLGNALDDANINLPSGAKFVPSNVKVCCVAAASAFPGTGCSGSGHTASADLVTSKVSNTGVDVATAGSVLSTKTAQAKEYLIKFNIAGLLSGIPKSAQTCRVYLESTFETSQARDINLFRRNAALFTTVVKSQRAFTISADNAEEKEGTTTISKTISDNLSIIVSSAIVGVGLVLTAIIAATAVGIIYYLKNKSNKVNALKLDDSIEMQNV
ncbi:hypothetical protein ABK040_011065 [Willaertia magna]